VEYTLPARADVPDPESLERLLHAIDTTALVDRDPLTGELRISSIASAGELVDLLRDAGCALSPSQLVRLPSTCCGGCGG
jgi:hypothetical protein